MQELAPARAARFTPTAVAIFLFALALRFLHLFALRGSPFLEAKLGDAAAYDAWAHEIAHGAWLGDTVFYQAPLYPYFLGTLYAFVSVSPVVVRSLQAVLGALACALLASAGARLFSRGAGLAAGLFLATYAPSIFLETQLQKSVLDLVFVCLSLWLVTGLREAPGRPRALALGLASGALVLARENALALAAVWGAWLATLPGTSRSRRVALAAAFAAGLAGLLLPVALRNWWVGGEAHLTTSQLGPNLYIGNHPGAKGGYEPMRPGRGSAEFERQDATELAEAALGRPLSPAEVSAYWTARVVDFARSEPAAFLRLQLRKVGLFLSSTELVDSEDQYTTAEHSWVLRVTGWLGRFGVLAPLALLGVFVSWPRRRELWWLYAAIAVYAASVVIFYVFSRYRYPAVPFLTLLAGAGLAGVRGFVASQRPPTLVACALALALLAAASNGIEGMSKASMGAVTHVNLANSFRRQGELERSVLHYREALARDPALEGAPHGLADALLELGQPREAIDVYRRAIEHRPDDPSLQRNAARLLDENGEPGAAQLHWLRLFALEPGAEDARLRLGEIELEQAGALARQGREAEALAGYWRASALLPDARAALWASAWIRATSPDPALRNPAEALALAERAAAGAPELTPLMLETLAAAYGAAGRFDEAAARAREALAVLAAAGRPPSPRIARALALYERGRPFVRAGQDTAEPLLE
jgi:tetratricopeptide (TPR) repeat protein